MQPDAGWVVEPGFESVADAFVGNFVKRGELGASFSVFRDGRPLLDVWGGIADAESGDGWQADSLSVIFSGSKGIVATCLLMLLDRGALHLDAPVCEYWPEFAASGKSHITIRDVVTHRAGLPGLTAPVRVEEITDHSLMATKIANQAQLTDPRAALMYHPLTYGWICAELIRRVTGKSAGEFVEAEISSPLGLDLFLGLPDGMEPRVARLELEAGWGQQGGVLDRSVASADDLVRTIWWNPPFLDRDVFPWNWPSFHDAQVPGANCIATARAVASLYDRLDRLVTSSTLALGRSVLERRLDPISGAEQVFGVGFELQTCDQPFGPPADAFGHTGAGGSVHGSWPTQRIGFSYCMNLLRDGQEVDERPQALLRALHRAC